MKDMMELMKLFSNPEEVNAMMTEAVNAVKPVLYHAAAEFMSIYKDYASNDEWKAVQAENKYKLFEAYKNAGFTEEQAMSLLLTETHAAVMRVKNSVDGSLKGLNK